MNTPLTPGECVAAVQRHYEGLCERGASHHSAIVMTADDLAMSTDRVLWCVNGYVRTNDYVRALVAVS